MCIRDSPYAGLDAIRSAVRSGEISALIVFGEDLITDAGFTAADLAKPTYLLQTHLLANPTATAAHLVLPAAAFSEKRGSMVNLSGRLQRLNPATSKPGQARDDWQILADLILAITGQTCGFSQIEDVFSELAATIPAFSGLSLENISSVGIPVIDTGYQIPLLATERARIAAGVVNG